MAKKIQRLAGFVALWVWWVASHSTFAVAPCTDVVEQTDLVQQDDFFGKNAQSTLHIGIKSWVKGAKNVIASHWAMGAEIAIGPVIEWHPINGIGLQTGLLYSYNYFFTVDASIDAKKLLDRSLLSFGGRFIEKTNALSAKNDGYIVHANLAIIDFHAISLPLFFRLYPEKSRKFVCYGGPRLILVFPGLEKKQYCPIHVNTASVKHILYNVLYKGKEVADRSGITQEDIEALAKKGLVDIYHSIFKINPDSAQTKSLNRFWNWSLAWDFGFEFRGNSGIVIGMNGLGIVLGYDCVK
ncbi:MAG: hypothetical protein NMK33_04765 [Candidatus Cardinium sp.]|uniref:hypothetical protein n=1 Tax=Cardinium endosymbiont of Dermatophagoides farinae TaxID=2597823 RepID=UPI001182A4ED|nr:hypothetical protein [Cardinium endosymbiont of Dermatophagoides farinae]TSJ80739.1 hypothetical protein FPG78_01535 [Cardinium endosymbiont of Dermatophagoides farinae]UWW96739.1 MAG: hypothetical protein NMK33_04765 [Candidatus Cardinium sp.]